MKWLNWLDFNLLRALYLFRDSEHFQSEASSLRLSKKYHKPFRTGFSEPLWILITDLHTAVLYVLMQAVSCDVIDSLLQLISVRIARSCSQIVNHGSDLNGSQQHWSDCDFCPKSLIRLSDRCRCQTYVAQELSPLYSQCFNIFNKYLNQIFFASCYYSSK